MNQHRCETCKNCSKNPNDDYFCLVMNDEIDFTDFEHTAKVGCASHSDFQRTKCAEILDDLVTKIIEKRKDFQVPDKHGRCPEVPGFEWLLDYISNKIAEEGGFVLTNINHSDFQSERDTHWRDLFVSDLRSLIKWDAEHGNPELFKAVVTLNKHYNTFSVEQHDKQVREKVLDELKSWCVQMKCNGCPYGGVLFGKITELRQAGEP